MIFFYLFACIPLLIGAVLWVMNKDVVWWEWLMGFVVALIVSGACHLIAFTGLTRDIETWSGQIITATYQPQWVEEYQQAHTRTVGSGKNQHTETYYTTEHRTHPERWFCNLNFGTENEEKEINKDFYNEICNNFGGEIKKVEGYRSGYDSGDKHDYIAINKTNFIYPVTTQFHWENRIKAAPSVFSFAKVPQDIPVHSYPENKNWRVSNRIIGAGEISILEWDRMNSRLGPNKKVNVILINFGDKDKEMATWQEAKWIGGKKNDLVLCYGNGWSYVFGWTEQEIVKRNLETILLQNKINESIIPKIEKEIEENYEIKDWKKFSYISIEPPWWSYLVLVIVMAITQTIFWFWAHSNQYNKEGKIRFFHGGYL